MDSGAQSGVEWQHEAHGAANRGRQIA
jgi:hypothetical protein